jgi:hypothetical protein
MADAHQPEFKAVELNRAFNVADIPVTRAENFTRVYANNSAFAMTFFDFCITFGEVSIEANSSAAVEQRVAVTMSIEHAKAMAIGILEHLANYEKGNGAIRTAPPIIAPQQ